MRPKGQPLASAGGRTATIGGSTWAGIDRVRTIMGFALVGASGIIVNQALLWGQVRFLGVNYLVAAVVATQGSTTWNFSLNELWVFRGAPHGAGRAAVFWRSGPSTT